MGARAGSMSQQAYSLDCSIPMNRSRAVGWSTLLHGVGEDDAAAAAGALRDQLGMLQQQQQPDAAARASRETVPGFSGSPRSRQLVGQLARTGDPISSRRRSWRCSAEMSSSPPSSPTSRPAAAARRLRRRFGRRVRPRLGRARVDVVFAPSDLAPGGRAPAPSPIRRWLERLTRAWPRRP